MTKCWLIPVLIAGLFGGEAFADCLPAPDTPAAVIEHFQRFNKPLPEQYCAKKAAPQAPQESDQYRNDEGPGDGPFVQYEGDPGGGYEADPEGGYESDQGGGYESDQEGGYEDDPGGGYEDDPGGGYESDQGGSYQGDQEDEYQGGGYQGDQEDGYVVPLPPPWSLDYWRNNDKGHKGGKHRKGDGKKGKGHGKRKSACKKAHMKWNESTKTCSKRR
jgi:hypothetical protein